MLRLIGVLMALGLSSVLAGQDRTFILSDETDDWLETAAADPTSPEGQLAEARRALATEQYVLAEALATQWLERHRRHPFEPEAYLIRADSLMKRGDYYQSLYDYEYITRIYSGSDAFVRALERELDIARLFASGTKRKLWGLRILNASDVAEELLIRIQERLPGSRLAEEAGYDLGEFYYDRQKMSLALEAFTLFIENYPNSQYISQARLRRIQAAFGTYKSPPFDPAGLYEARAQLQRLRVVDPVTADQIGAEGLLRVVDEKDAEKRYGMVRWYLQTNDYVAAEYVIRRLVRRYPRTVAAHHALELVPQIIERLPEGLRADLPDYEALRAAAGITSAPAAPEAEEDSP